MGQLTTTLKQVFVCLPIPGLQTFFEEEVLCLEGIGKFFEGVRPSCVADR